MSVLCFWLTNIMITINTSCCLCIPTKRKPPTQICIWFDPKGRRIQNKKIIHSLTQWQKRLFQFVFWQFFINISFGLGLYLHPSPPSEKKEPQRLNMGPMIKFIYIYALARFEDVNKNNLFNVFWKLYTSKMLQLSL